MSIKSAVRNIVRKFGYDIVYLKPKHDFDNLYVKLFCKFSKTTTILDVGSHRGESIDRFKRVFPSLSIHGFEPQSDNFQFLTNKYRGDDSVILNNCGVGEEAGELEFHSFKKTDVGSFVGIDPDSAWAKVRSKEFDTVPTEFETGTNKVPVQSIDEYVKATGLKQINLLKIDTQGFEDDVLKGCKDSLSNNVIDFIELELIITGPYQKKLMFKDIESLFEPYGYKMYGIQSGSNYYDSPILQFDLLFARKGCYIEGDYMKVVK
jgi:FkbM family methyltransferase